MIYTTVYKVTFVGAIDGVLSEAEDFEHVEDVRARFPHPVMVEHRYITAELVFIDQYWPGQSAPRKLFRRLDDPHLLEIPRA